MGTFEGRLVTVGDWDESPQIPGVRSPRLTIVDPGFDGVEPLVVVERFVSRTRPPFDDYFGQPGSVPHADHTHRDPIRPSGSLGVLLFYP